MSNITNMNKFSIVFLFAIATVVVVAQQSTVNDCFNSWSTRTIGRRVPGDRLLFRDIRSVNFTSPVNHDIRFSYSNANITQWSLGFDPVIEFRIIFSNIFSFKLSSFRVTVSSHILHFHIGIPIFG